MSDGITRACRDSFKTYVLPNARPLLLATICITIVALSIVEFFTQVRDGLGVLEFDDEMSELVIAKMIVHGKHLYKDVFDTHGALPSIITHLYALMISPSDFSYVRLSQAILAIISCIAVSCSAAFKTLLTRAWAAALYLLFLAFVWNAVGFNVLWYDSMGGFLFVVVIAQLIVPLLVSEEPYLYGAFASGVASGLVLFCAISNVAAALLFGASSAVLLRSVQTQKRHWGLIWALSLGIVFSTLVVGTWLLTFGDLVGYFIYHIYFNLVVYRPFSLSGFLRLFASSFGAVHFLALLLVPCFSITLFFSDNNSNVPQRNMRKTLAFALLALGIISTNMLGRTGCADASLVNCSFAVMAMSLALLLQRALMSQSARMTLPTIAVTLSVVALIGKIGTSADFWFDAKKSEMSEYAVSMKPGQDSIDRFISAITKSDGDILALPWHAAVYVKTDRTPASGNINYWSKQAEYYRNPVDGYKIDVCADLAARKPTVIWFFNLRMSADGSIDEYEPCVLTFITGGYAPLRLNSPWYIRKDIFNSVVDKLPRDADTQTIYQGVQDVMRRTSPLAPAAPIEIRMSPTHLDRQIPLKRLGIMLTTYGRKNTGDAELRLTGPNGSEFVQTISLTSLEDNRYQYFDVDAKRYTAGEIRPATGGGVGAWESELESLRCTCAIFEYVDNSRRYTPACPIM